MEIYGFPYEETTTGGAGGDHPEGSPKPSSRGTVVPFADDVAPVTIELGKVMSPNNSTNDMLNAKKRNY
jgi:hypothetical protein